MTAHIEHGDCLEVMRRLVDEGVRVDSIVTDPPYGLSFMGKKWDHAVPAREVWEAAFALLKPGGHLLSFFGTRTYHRGVVNIEDAGFEIRDQIGWLFGSGFPKSHNVGNGWGTALKPAWEPVCLARKPLIGTVAENVQKHRTGALNIDGCRVETDDNRARMNGARVAGTSYVVQREAKFIDPGGAGRWPANVIHDGSEEVLAAFPAEAGGGRSAARFFYCAKASGAERAGSKHPTVKPLALMRYLCRLVTPPGGTVLDPFAGSGSTLQAAIEEGFSAIGIEREAEYVANMERRLERAQPRLVA